MYGDWGGSDGIHRGARLHGRRRQVQTPVARGVRHGAGRHGQIRTTARHEAAGDKLRLRGETLQGHHAAAVGGGEGKARTLPHLAETARKTGRTAQSAETVKHARIYRPAAEDKQIGRIALKGITYENTETNKISAIEYTSYGGTIEILAPDSDNLVTVEKTIRGISRLADEDNDTGELNLNIEMLNSSIRAEGNNTKSEAGIYIDGTKDSKNQTYYRGLININISGKNKEETYKDITSVKLEEGVTDLCFFAFNDATNLKEINIPSTLETISLSSLSNLNLDTLYVSDTKKQLNLIETKGATFTFDFT